MAFLLTLKSLSADLSIQHPVALPWFALGAESARAVVQMDRQSPIFRCTARAFRNSSHINNLQSTKIEAFRQTCDVQLTVAPEAIESQPLKGTLGLWPAHSAWGVELRRKAVSQYGEQRLSEFDGCPTRDGPWLSRRSVPGDRHNRAVGAPTREGVPDDTGLRAVDLGSTRPLTSYQKRTPRCARAVCRWTSFRRKVLESTFRVRDDAAAASAWLASPVSSFPCPCRR